MQGGEKSGRTHLIDGAGTVRWILTVPEGAYDTYRLSQSVLFRILYRRTLRWRFGVFLGTTCGLFALLTGLMSLQPYVLAYLGSNRLGVVYHLGTHEFVLINLALAGMLCVLLHAFYRALNQQIVRLLYDDLRSMEGARELMMGDQGILIATRHSEMLVPWERVTGLCQIERHWVLPIGLAAPLCIPVAVIDEFPDRDALIGFLRDKAGQGQATH